jgi:hypothetical protein
MKRIILSLIFVASFAFAEFSVKDVIKYTYITSLSITNQDTRAIQPAGFYCKYAASTTGTVSFSFARGTLSTTMISTTFTNHSSIFITRDSFDGFILNPNDVFVISDSTGVTNTCIVPWIYEVR